MGKKQLRSELQVNPELVTLLEQAKLSDVSEEELREQRISFAFGNALDNERITKESVRQSHKSKRLA